FPRYLENRVGSTLHYLGSLVSFFYSLPATAVCKCCTIVYSPPSRVENFDTHFQNIQTLPLGTPPVTYFNALRFEQALLPCQSTPGAPRRRSRGYGSDHGSAR